MTSVQRLVARSSSLRVAPETQWRVVLLLLAAAAFVVVRACGYQFASVATYAAYLAAYVVLPGVVVLTRVHRAPISPVQLLALAVPTGFALEIFMYLGLAALGAKALYAWTPLGWLALALLSWRVGRKGLVRWQVAGNHAGVAAGLALAFLIMALTAAGQIYVESPLADGLPARAIFHDWVYLISRAAVIKHTWPLDDPSLAGTPLQYHYFMMVHAAAASWTTDVEIATVMLRLIYVPLIGALVAQAYLLGRAVARSPWGGVLAALITVVASEVSWGSRYSNSMYLGLFERWLFVSPTFFFGMVYCGALLLAVHRGGRPGRLDFPYYAWLVLLGTAGTGAKGTLLPVMLGALGLWGAWRWWREGRLPLRLIAGGVCLGGAFLVVYLHTMSSWGSGDAKLRPFHVFEVTAFWRQHLPGWTEVLARSLPAPAAAALAQAACAGVVFAGTCGVSLLAIPYLVWHDHDRRERRLVGWLGAVCLVSVALGMLVELNGYGELYVILMMRLPMAVLTAGFFVAAARRIRSWWRPPSGITESSSPFVRPPLAAAVASGPRPRLPRFLVGSGLVVFAVVLAVQASLWWARNRPGLQEWLNASTELGPDGYMGELREALLWVRSNTEPDAVLVANAFTPENLQSDHWGALDHTLMGVHFYYSALSERRLWLEGPHYLLHATRVRVRLGAASNFFYRGCALAPELIASAPCYVLLDRRLHDDAEVALPLGARVFSNERMSVYRLSPPPVPPEGRGEIAAHNPAQ